MDKKILTCFDWFLIGGIIAANVIYSSMSDSLDLIGSVAAITGVACVVLVAKGSIWNYIFGVVNVSLYAFISYKASLYGDAGLNALYYFPMQFIGWWQWRKRGASISKGNVDDQRVKARAMTWKQRCFLAVGCISAVVVVGFVLEYLGDPQPFKDSTTTVLSIVAQALMACAFMEQWILWIITNVVSVVMWCVCASRGDAHAGVMVLMWTFYLMNSLNGFRVWRRLAQE